MADKPIRNGLTVGMTLVSGAIGMACVHTSKRGWWQWAKTTSLEHMLRSALSQVDGQHFWDLMDALPAEAIEQVEEQIWKRVRKTYALESDTLYFDTTNFFTFIATTNERCTIARRGKNKQKRADLRQVGLAMVVTPKDYVPIFHVTYQGNRHDSTVFKQLVGTIKRRMLALGMDLEKHALVFDRGNNSKTNMASVAKAKMHYVRALTPYHQKQLIAEAGGHVEAVTVRGQQLAVYRSKQTLWDEERSLLVFVSHRLKTGQLRGIYKSLHKKLEQLEKLQRSLRKASKEPLDEVQLKTKIKAIVKGQFITGVIRWSLNQTDGGRFELAFKMDQDKPDTLEDKLGFRILMTDRHDWSTTTIIQTFYGQSFVEHAFKNIKNPYHLTLKPQHHWTDQKSRVHYCMGVLGYLMSTLIWKQAREKANYSGTLDNLLDTLNNIRLATCIEKKAGRGKPRVTHQLEQMDEQESALIQALASGTFTTPAQRLSKLVYPDDNYNPLHNSGLQHNPQGQRI